MFLLKSRNSQFLIILLMALLIALTIYFSNQRIQQIEQHIPMLGMKTLPADLRFETFSSIHITSLKSSL